jgi:hypothetical protein
MGDVSGEGVKTVEDVGSVWEMLAEADGVGCLGQDGVNDRWRDGEHRRTNDSSLSDFRLFDQESEQVGPDEHIEVDGDLLISVVLLRVTQLPTSSKRRTSHSPMRPIHSWTRLRSPSEIWCMCL